MSWEPVYRLVRKIPRGRVTTYGELAQALRLPGGARAVGFALAATPRGQGAKGRIRVPEHYAALQRKLLESEGVAIDGEAIDLRRYGWSPLRKRAGAKATKRAARKR